MAIIRSHQNFANMVTKKSYFVPLKMKKTCCHEMPIPVLWSLWSSPCCSTTFFLFNSGFKLSVPNFELVWFGTRRKNGMQYSHADMHKIAHNRPQIDIMINIATIIATPIDGSLVTNLLPEIDRWMTAALGVAGSCLWWWHVAQIDWFFKSLWLLSWWVMLPFEGTFKFNENN